MRKVAPTDALVKRYKPTPDHYKPVGVGGRLYFRGTFIWVSVSLVLCCWIVDRDSIVTLVVYAFTALLVIAGYRHSHGWPPRGMILKMLNLRREVHLL